MTQQIVKGVMQECFFIKLMLYCAVLRIFEYRHYCIYI